MCLYALFFGTKPKLPRTKEEVLNAVIENPHALKYTTEQFQDDEDIVLRAIDGDPLALEFASSRFKEDTVLITKLIMQNPKVFSVISSQLQCSFSFVLNLAEKVPTIVEYITNPTLKSCVEKQLKVEKKTNTDDTKDVVSSYDFKIEVGPTTLRK